MITYRYTLVLFIALGYFISLPTDVRAEEVPWGPKIIKLADVTISCEAYQNYYRDIVEDAAKNNSPKWNAAAKSRMDEAFGTYKTAWIKSSTWIMDKYGKTLPTHKSIRDIQCETKYKTVKYTDSHTKHTKYKNEPYLEKKNVYKKVRLGYVDDCEISVVQDVWPELGKCGSGTIVRNFKIGVWCGGQEYTLRLTQKIHVVPSCSFSKNMLDIPDVQFMCGPIKYKNNYQINLPDYIKPVSLYRGWETSCGSSKIHVSYHDKHYKLIQEHRQYVIIRTWEFSDQCTGKKLTAEQKIMVDGLCRDDDPEEPDDDPDKPDDPKDPDPDPEPDPEPDTIQFALLHPLEDIYISHQSYQETYKGIVDLSLESFRKGQTDLSAELLDAIFGTYEIKSDTTNVDSVTVYTMECNDGIPVDAEIKLSNGVLQSDCPDNLTIHQVLSEVHNPCGELGLTRKFIVESQCDTVVMRDTFSQRILFRPTCALTAAVFEVPADTVMCGILDRDTSGRIVLPITNNPNYVGDSMRNFDIDYKFVVTYSSEDPDRIDVARVWTYSDTCLDETTMLTQHLTLLDTCQSNLDRAKSREVVMDVSRENIERGISDDLKLALSENRNLEEGNAYVYPNPFSQEVSLHFYQDRQGATDIRILDVRGQLVSEKRLELDPGTQKVRLDASHFKAPGLFIVQVVKGDQVENFRVLYQKD